MCSYEKIINNTVYLWQINWQAYIDQKNMFWEVLSIEEKSRASYLKFQKNKFIIIRGVLRFLIEFLLNLKPNELQLIYNAFGKPYIGNDQKLQFNLSHSFHQVIYGFCLNHSVGVDIEYHRLCTPVIGLSKRYFSLEENRVLDSLKISDKRTAFFKGWVQKEAIVKSLGVGFNIPFRGIEVDLAFKEFQCYYRQSPYFQGLIYSIRTMKNFSAALAIPMENNDSSIDVKYFTHLKQIV